MDDLRPIPPGGTQPLGVEVTGIAINRGRGKASDPRAPETLLGELAAVAAVAADCISPGGGGLCLPTTAAICHVLATHGTPNVLAIAGAYYDDTHWWAEVGGLIVDPTRGQFDDGPLVSVAEDGGPYSAEGAFPPGWTREHVLLEGVRAFMFDESGRRYAEELMLALEGVIAGKVAAV